MFGDQTFYRLATLFDHVWRCLMMFDGVWSYLNSIKHSIKQLQTFLLFSCFLGDVWFVQPAITNMFCSRMPDALSHSLVSTDIAFCLHVSFSWLENFSNDDRNGNENVISKSNFSFLYLFRDYSNLLNLENAGNYSGTKLRLLDISFEPSQIPPCWNCKQDTSGGCGTLGNFVAHNSLRSAVWRSWIFFSGFFTQL